MAGGPGAPLRVARRLYRGLFPRRRDPVLDAELPRVPADDAFEAAYERVTRDERDDEFVRARYFEGRRWRHVLSATAGTSGRILDVGGGNGAVELALAATGAWVASVEISWNDKARELHREAGVPFRRVIASAAALPFRSGAFAHVLCLETIEHLRDARRAGREMVRTLAGGGDALVTTPSRLRFLLAPDPHFGIRGLLLLPSRAQRAIAARRGFSRADHFVDTIYWTVGQVRRVFPSCEVVTVLSRSRAPRALVWDAILLRKI